MWLLSSVFSHLCSHMCSHICVLTCVLLCQVCSLLWRVAGLLAIPVVALQAGLPLAAIEHAELIWSCRLGWKWRRRRGHHIYLCICVSVRLCVCLCQYVALVVGSSHILGCHVCQHVALTYKAVSVLPLWLPLRMPLGHVVHVFWLSLKVCCNRAW